ncbi:MAG: MFS transporter [Alysiella sp.]|uniref:AmpG family muropeptide MFS transporter n=1 Tax=Alysiella sp. TaxID=1872483 RepID=UPI0026DAD1E1|nr:MFS transporter [Alysiella sp.]MDO4433819.1 MFS transporter [Alysiella sp.]
MSPHSALPVPHKWRLMTTMLLLGFSAGLPLMLIFSTLSLWLTEAGVERKTVTLFSWAALAYSFKFIWSPLLDSFKLPILSHKLGQRRAWLLLAQSFMIAAVCIMASVNPNTQVSGSLNIMAVGAVLLGFASATQDIAIDAYRIEAAPNDAAAQSAAAAAYTAGYRIAMFVSGAGSLLLATHFGSTTEQYQYHAWRNTYWIMAAIMGIGILTTLFIHEPTVKQHHKHHLNQENGRLLLAFMLAIAAFIAVFRVSGSLLPETGTPFIKFIWESVRMLLSLLAFLTTAWLTVQLNIVSKQTATQTLLEPLTDFFQRYGKRAILLLALIGLYRISDIVSGVISNVFYADLGFSKEEIAWAVKTFGVIMSVIGGFAGGLLAQKFRIMNMMMLGAIAAAATNLLFALLAMHGHDLPLMYTAVGLDNFAAGLAGTVFVAFLSALTNIRFTAVQYALFSSLMTLFPKMLGGYSGTIVNEIGYAPFFIFTAVLGVPILFLVWHADQVLFQSEKN